MHLHLFPPVLHFVPPLLTAAFALALGAALAHGSVLQLISEGRDKFVERVRLWRWGARRRDACTSTNSAFDAYRRETLRKLEDEAREFRVFLDGLKQAADAADFESFLKARRERGAQRS
jgi:hypothetical protein